MEQTSNDSGKDKNIEKPVEQIQQKAHEAARAETAPRRERSLRTILFQAYVIAALSVFSILALLASTSAYFPIDVTVTRFVQTYNGTWLLDIMRFISWFGFSPQAMLVVLALALVLYIFGFHWEAVFAFLASTFDGSLNTAVKIIVHRPRPEANLVHVVQKVAGYSYPSGHVMFYTGFFGFMLFLVYTLLKPSLWRTLLMIVFGLMVVLVGVSRIYLGEHWASDVLGGYLLGSLALIIEIIVYRWSKKRFFSRQPVASEASAKDGG